MHWRDCVKGCAGALFNFNGAVYTKKSAGVVFFCFLLQALMSPCFSF